MNNTATELLEMITGRYDRLENIAGKYHRPHMMLLDDKVLGDLVDATVENSETDIEVQYEIAKLY